jgi:transcriptional regulator with GAF, ATPase, and Fis domain
VSIERERAIAKAFVSLADTMVTGFDVVELLNSLTEECARLLDVASAGLLLADRQNVLHVVAASSERTRNLELFQLQREQGPCLDCFHSGRSVSVADLSNEEERWPQFVPVARQAGFASVHAIPMRVRDNVLGTLGLFGVHVGALNDDDLELGQALAHVASVVVVAGGTIADGDLVVEQLQNALDSRVVIEQAKGILAHQSGIEMDDAFAQLRRYARNHNELLTMVAKRLVSRDLLPQTVLAPQGSGQSNPSQR